jgi:uncharacterized membrane protein YheB (UPF0754 family)
MNYWFFIIPFIGAFIGWGINKIAVKLIFHPQTPKKILGITFQGVIPKRRQQLAESLGKFAQAEFASINFEQKLSDPSNLQKAMPVIEGHIDNFLRNKLKEQMPMLGMFIGDKTINTLKEIFLKELEILFPEIMKQFAGNMKNELEIGKIVAGKLSAIAPEKLENSIAEQLRFIAVSGAITGFLVGLIQLVIMLLIK